MLSVIFAADSLHVRIHGPSQLVHFVGAGSIDASVEFGFGFSFDRIVVVRFVVTIGWRSGNTIEYLHTR